MTQGKAKRRAWQKVVDDGKSQAETDSEYVKLVNKLKEDCGFDPSKAPEAVGAK